jgi:aminoglycoside phosphotransferase (APT) family kinase protein
MGLVPRYRMVLYRSFDGERLDRVALPERVEQGVQAAARWLRQLHTSDIDLSRQMSLDQEVVSGQQWANLIGDAFPDMSELAHSVAARWRHHVPSDGTATAVPIHKDFHAGHVLLGDGVCVIDLDEARRGDPALDVAHFCAYLEVAKGAEASRRLQELFRHEYVGPDSAPGGVDIQAGYSAYTWLKIAKQWAARSGPFQGRTPSERRVGVRRALGRAESWLSA